MTFNAEATLSHPVIHVVKPVLTAGGLTPVLTSTWVQLTDQKHKSVLNIQILQKKSSDDSAPVYPAQI